MTVEHAEMQLMSAEDFLVWETTVEAKHEFIGGMVYAMAGGNNRHNLIASNALGALYAQFRGKLCKAYNSDTKVRVPLPTHTRFYYPDAMVVCQSSAAGLSYQEGPAVIIEVISERTRRTDQQEKREAYLALGTVQVYLMIEQSSAVAVVWRRGEQGFRREVWEGLASVVPLPEVGVELPLAEVYEGVTLGADPEDDEELG